MTKTIQAPQPHHGEHLAQLRKAAGLTQVVLAQTLGVSQQNIARWEATDRPPPSKLLPELAGLFGVTVEEILNVAPNAAAKKRGPPSRGHRLMDKVERLPPRYQEKIYDVVGALLDQYSRAA